MPLFVNDENEILVEDDRPTPDNTPSAGSVSNSHVVECGNRVLELLNKHKREIQSRMTKRGNSFRGMLERELENRNRRNENLRDKDQSQGINPIAPDSSTAKQNKSRRSDPTVSPVQRTHSHPHPENLKKVSIPQKLVVISSEEYFDPPKPQPPATNKRNVEATPSFRYGKRGSSNSTPPRKSSILKSSEKRPSDPTPPKILPSLHNFHKRHFASPPTVNSKTTDPSNDCIHEPDDNEECLCCADNSDKVNANRAMDRPEYDVQTDMIPDQYYPSQSTKHEESIESMGKSQAIINDSSTSDEEEDYVRKSQTKLMSKPRSRNTIRLSSSRGSTPATVSESSDGILAMIREHTWEVCVVLGVLVLIIGIFVLGKDIQTNYKNLMTAGGDLYKPKFTRYKGPVM